jgi:hypothetical protein
MARAFLSTREMVDSARMSYADTKSEQKDQINATWMLKAGCDTWSSTG